jgi:hypothetical protein
MELPAGRRPLTIEKKTGASEVALREWYVISA